MDRDFFLPLASLSHFDCIYFLVRLLLGLDVLCTACVSQVSFRFSCFAKATAENGISFSKTPGNQNSTTEGLNPRCF